MPELNEVVNLRVVAHRGATHHSPIDATVSAYLDVIANHYIANLRHFFQFTRGIGFKPKTIGTNHGSAMDDTALADYCVVIYFYTGI